MNAQPTEPAVPADFGAVFAAHHRRLYRLALLLTGDRALAEDVTSEAFARVYPVWRAGKVEGEAQYLNRVLVNIVRSGGRRRRVADRHEPVLQASARTAAESGEADVDARDALRTALAELPERQRTCLILRFFADWSIDEIADDLGVVAGTVKSQISRGLERLRGTLEEGPR